MVLEKMVIQTSLLQCAMLHDRHPDLRSARPPPSSRLVRTVIVRTSPRPHSHRPELTHELGKAWIPRPIHHSVASGCANLVSSGRWSYGHGTGGGGGGGRSDYGCAADLIFL